MQDEHRLQRFGPLPETEFRPDISRGNYPPRDQAERNTREKPDHLLRHDDFSFSEFHRFLQQRDRP
jgi:hypothetical protein